MHLLDFAALNPSSSGSSKLTVAAVILHCLCDVLSMVWDYLHVLTASGGMALLARRVEEEHGVIEDEGDSEWAPGNVTGVLHSLSELSETCTCEWICIVIFYKGNRPVIYWTVTLGLVKKKKRKEPEPAPRASIVPALKQAEYQIRHFSGWELSIMKGMGSYLRVVVPVKIWKPYHYLTGKLPVGKHYLQVVT